MHARKIIRKIILVKLLALLGKGEELFGKTQKCVKFIKNNCSFGMQDIYSIYIYSMNIKRMGMLNRKFDTNRNTKKKEKNNLNFFFIKEKILKAKQ